MKKECLNIPKNMQAIEIEEFGEADNLKLCVRPTPQISNNQILIKVSFAGVNRPDILQRQGNYKVPEDASDIPGLEVSGIITEKKGSDSKFKPTSKSSKYLGLSFIKKIHHICYLGAKRTEPSSLIVSPLSNTLVTMLSTNIAYSKGVPKRLGKTVVAIKLF